jgi:hypothetical protein
MEMKMTTQAQPFGFDRTDAAWLDEIEGRHP